MTAVHTFQFAGLGAEAREKALEKLRESRRYKVLHDELHADMLYPALESHLTSGGVAYDMIDVIVDGDDVTANVWVEHGAVDLVMLERIGTSRFPDVSEYELVRDILDYEDLYYYRTPEDAGTVYLDEIDASEVTRNMFGDDIEAELEAQSIDEDDEDAWNAAYYAEMVEYEDNINAAMESLREAVYDWIHHLIDAFEDEARYTVSDSEDDFIIDALCEETRFTADGTPTEVS